MAAAIAETGATTPKDMGKVMKAVMPKLAGKSADGTRRQRSGAPSAWRLTTAPRASVARSAASAGAATMTSRVLGVVREQVLASYFGASDAMDAYNVAFRVPEPRCGICLPKAR